MKSPKRDHCVMALQVLIDPLKENMVEQNDITSYFLLGNVVHMSNNGDGIYLCHTPLLVSSFISDFLILNLCQR